MRRIKPVWVVGSARGVPCRWRPRKWTCCVPDDGQPFFSSLMLLLSRRESAASILGFSIPFPLKV